MIISESSPNRNELKSPSVNISTGLLWGKNWDFSMAGPPIRGMIDAGLGIEGTTMKKAITSELILKGY
jgi:hypothetical protein